MLCPRVLEHRGYAHEVQNAEQHLAMDLVSPDISHGAVRFDPKDFVLFREIDLGSVSWNSQPHLF